MKKFTKKIKLFDRAQTMVEFALVLPILAVLIFGVLEVGRMAFLYSTIATASREAVRYGSATGDVASGNTIKRYADCAGIRAAAQKVDFLNVITDANILITYDHGPGTTWSGALCPVGGTGPTSITSGDRIRVVVSGDFNPIVGLVPLSARTITSSNYHTILGSVSIVQPGFCPYNPAILDTDPACVAPATLECTSPQVPNPAGDACINPPMVCTPPQVPNPAGDACIDPPLECTPPQVLNPAGDACINPPLVCTPPQVLNPAGDACINPPLVCTPPQVLNPAGDACIDPPPTCGAITANTPAISPDLKSATWTITNATPVILNTVTVTWPAGTSTLTNLKVDDVSISAFAPKTSPATLSVGRNLAAGSHTLVFTFSSPLNSGTFSATSTFTTDGCSPVSGATEVYIVTHPIPFPNVLPNQYTSPNWTLTNRIGAPLQISSIVITWQGGVSGTCNSSTNKTNFERLTLGSQTWSTTATNEDSCIGYTIIPSSTWWIPVNSSSITLTFKAKETTGITVKIYLTGSSYIVDSTNPLQKD